MRAVLAGLLVSMLVVGGMVAYYGRVDDGIGLDSFRTRAEFHAYIEALQQGQWDAMGDFRGPQTGTFTDITVASDSLDAEGGFSGTNVQVAGVDEADRVKTDGEFLYLVAEDSVVLVRAHPPALMGVVSRVTADQLAGDREGEVRILGLFLHERTLVVISSLHAGAWRAISDATDAMLEWQEPLTIVSLISVADPSEPASLHSFEFTGAYQASRMKGAVVFLVLHQGLWVQEDEASYPTACVDGRCEPYDAHSIYFDVEAPGTGSLTNIVAVDLESAQIGYLSVLTGFASTVYMSPSNLYISFAKWGHLGGTFPQFDLIARETAFTSIYRIAVDGTDLVPAAGGRVEGWLLNQFSLDEHRSYLRVATTTWGDTLENNVYVLDGDLSVVGALVGLAPNESIYSARFVGDIGYLVTFEKVDPFFVLDLSDPARPEVLGFLKIPGFSEYLHPIDATHVLGVGKDTIEDPSGRFAWFQGLKLSLFDVSDFRAPKEVAKYLVGDRGSSSPVLYDHKAFLYLEGDRLVVLPVDMVEIVEPTNDGGADLPPWEYGTEAWQGALVLSVDPVDGFEVRARITHLPPDEEACPYASGPYRVTRSMYIGAHLYTISSNVLQAHSLADFSEAGSLVYGDASGSDWC